MTTQTTLDRLKEVKNFAFKGPHYSDELLKARLDMLINILIDEREEKENG